jgi:hypothetical protein
VPVVTYRVLDNARIGLTWPPMTETDSFHVFRDGVDLATTRCLGCSFASDGKYGTSYSFAVEARFAQSQYLLPGRSPTTSLLVPHVITAPTTTSMLARGGRADIPITNTANPDGVLGGLVSGSGNGIQVNDPGHNTLAMLVSTGAPYGYQEIRLTGPAQASAMVRAAVTRTPGMLLLTMPATTSRRAAYSNTMLRIAQVDATRWTATFGNLAPMEFTRDGNLGGADFCANSDALGLVVSADGPRYGVMTDWVVRLLDLKGASSVQPIALEARRLSADGSVGLVPMVYTSPDCTVIAIVDVNTVRSPAYRLRVFDVFRRQWLGEVAFDVANVQYDVIQSSLNQFSTTEMRLVTTHPAGLMTTQVAIK